MKRFFPTFLFFCMAFAACKKLPLPKEESSEPVFYSTCEINGVRVSLQAGQNDYYMFASHYQNASNVYVYKAELRQRSCNSGCNYALSILINDDKISALNAPMNPDSVLKPGFYSFNDGSADPVSYICSFTPHQPQSTYNWNFSDGYSLASQNGSRTLKANQDYSVALTVQNSSCSISHQNTFRPGSPLTTIVTATNDVAGSPTTYTFWSSNNSPGISYEWDFGDSTTSASSNPVHTYQNQNYYTVKLKLSKAGEKPLYSYYQVAAFPFQVCGANYNSIFTPVPNVNALGAIAFQLMDPEGNVYSTEDHNQSASNKVEIVSIEDYQTSESIMPAKKIKLRFNCDLKDGNSIIQVRNGEAVIAVTYKK